MGRLTDAEYRQIYMREKPYPPDFDFDAFERWTVANPHLPKRPKREEQPSLNLETPKGNGDAVPYDPDFVPPPPLQKRLPEPDTDPKQLERESPPFPSDVAFSHGFENFAQAYNGIDWICDAFNFAAALSQISMALGRKHRVNVLGRHYPNFYQCILGRSHLAAKSPTLDRATSGVSWLRSKMAEPDHIRIIGSINSAEGFRSEFATHNNGDWNDPLSWYEEPNGVRGFLPVDEFGSLLAKTRQKGSEGIAVELTKTYNPSVVPLENNTRQNKTYGENWVVNVLAASTMEWYEQFISTGDFSSGFLNRFVFYLHEQVPIKTYKFKAVDFGALGRWQDILQEISLQSLLVTDTQEWVLAEEADEIFDHWFTSTYARLLSADTDDLQAEASARVGSHIVKLAMIYAILDKNGGKIGPKHILNAIAVGEYWAKVMGLTLETMDFDRRSKSERKVLEAVGRLTQEKPYCTRRQIRSRLNSKYMSNDELNKTIEALIVAESLCFNNENRSVRYWLPGPEGDDE